MAAYTTADEIAELLGVTFTPEQEAQADQLAQVASNVIDRYTGRSWQGTSPIAGELANVLPAAPPYPGAFGIIFLAAKPAVAVSSIALRTGYPNPTTTPLDPTAFELVDPVNGVVTITGGYGYGYGYPGLLAVVDYTYADAVPEDIQLAAKMIAAGQMARVVAFQRGSQALDARPELAGLESIAVGQNDVSVKLSSAVTSGSGAGSASAGGSAWIAPGSAVAGILDGYRRPAIA